MNELSIVAMLVLALVLVAAFTGWSTGVMLLALGCVVACIEEDRRS